MLHLHFKRHNKQLSASRNLSPFLLFSFSQFSSKAHMKHIPIQTFFDGQGCMSGSSACWNREWGVNE